MFDYLDDPIPFTPDSALRSSVRARGTSLRRRHHLRLTIASTGAVAILLIAGLGGFARWRADQITRITMADIPQVDHGPVALPVTDPGLDGSFNALVVGVDSRIDVGAAPGSRTDTMMIVHVDRAASKVRIVSVPRDLWITPAGVGADERLNAVLERDGAPALIRTVNQIFGVPIHHYVQVDFGDFKHLVDGAGGVPIVFDAPVMDVSTGLNLDVGCHVLDGEAALALARSRHLTVKGPDGRWNEDGLNDLGRQRRQQVVVEAIVRRVGERAVGRGGLAGLVDLATADLVVDDRLGRQDLLDLGALSLHLAPGAVSSFFPPTTEATRGTSAVLLLAPGGAEAATAFLDGDPGGSTGPTSPGTDGNPFTGPDLIHLDSGHECGD
jgi:LCP family protein required for cell wall assembly